MIDPSLDGSRNMAIDEALLDTCASRGRESCFPVLRFYQWKTPTISIGYNQKVEESVDPEFCRRMGIEVTRRPTGGKAVLHDRELTYSITADCSDHPFTSSVAENYIIISEAIIEGLRVLGIDAIIADAGIPAYDPFSREHCFSRLSRYEISYRQLKIVGSAQRRRKKAFLQHGSLLLDMDRVLLAGALRSEGIQQAGSQFVTISEAAEREVSFDELAETLAKSFQKTFGVSLLRGSLSQKERNLAEELLIRKYITAAGG
ncbi:MAG: biotin/lipoate A/B protein ligase family protein [Acidobacteriota bacterium]